MWAEYLPFLLAASLGFRHAFETDHLVAVGNIVTKRNSVTLSLKDGVYWGLGHSSSILLMGILILSLRCVIPGHYFKSMEGLVGLMIICLGLFRLWQYFKLAHLPMLDEAHTNKREAALINRLSDPSSPHRISFAVGLVHGLAGSGILIATAISAVKALGNSFIFLVIFSIGSVGGMVLAAALFSLPFSKKLQSFKKVQHVLVILSCGICVMLGARIIVESWLS
jgi:high-affinity nickel permease